MERAKHIRILVCALGALPFASSYAQTYTHSTVGVQNTYTGACMVTTCSGTYYDDGGAAGNYALNVNNIFRTFCPNTPGMCMRATFTSFSMNDTYFLCFGPNSCCDYLSILNGPVQNSLRSTAIAPPRRERSRRAIRAVVSPSASYPTAASLCRDGRPH